MTDCSYEFYTIHVDSLSSSTSNNFTTFLYRPLKSVVQVSVLNASFDARTSSSNVAYLHVDEFSSAFNDITGVVSGNVISSSPGSKERVRGSLARFNVNSTDRTIYNQVDYSTQTQFIRPIEKLDRINTELLDEYGNTLSVISNTYVSYRITCLRDNMCPKPKKEKKHHR